MIFPEYVKVHQSQFLLPRYEEGDYDDFERVHYFSTAGLLQWKGL